MASDDDFTFCQVGLPADQDDLKESKTMPDINGVSLKDTSTDGIGDNRSSSSPWKEKFSSDGIVKHEATVGSLSFNVIDTTSRQRMKELPGQAASKNNINSVSSLEKEKTSARTPIPRAKVPFEKGYSQMDWLKLTRSHPDLAGLKGQSNRRLLSMDEVKQHQTGGDMWTVFKGRVYNIAPYMKFHPGGVDMLTKAVGRDCTSLFNKYHAWVNAEALLDKCLVGVLENRTDELQH